MQVPLFSLGPACHALPSKLQTQGRHSRQEQTSSGLRWGISTPTKQLWSRSPPAPPPSASPPLDHWEKPGATQIHTPLCADLTEKRQEALSDFSGTITGLTLHEGHAGVRRRVRTSLLPSSSLFSSLFQKTISVLSLSIAGQSFTMVNGLGLICFSFQFYKSKTENH